MLERLIIRNFKKFEAVEIELGSTVVFVGPNNSGKTSALQALALWDLGLRRWHEKRGQGTTATERTGVVINRRDLVTIPVPDASLFWRGLRLRHAERIAGKQKTSNIRIEIEVQGIAEGKTWAAALEFDFANAESIYCRPLGASTVDRDARPALPPAALDVRLAYLPPMSGLAANETRLDPGAVNVRLGEGRTAEVLRNLCYQIATQPQLDSWERLAVQLQELFGVHLEQPVYVAERGEITLAYRDEAGTRLDLSAAGRGLQQTLLLLAFFHANPGSVLLLDEPDAHLEILRQRQIYQTLSDLARTKSCQLIAATHSEVLLNEAGDRDVVVAFVGRPHRIDDRGSQVLKSLRSLGFDAYLQAEQKGWVLYLEGSTDLAILQAFARTLEHPAAEVLERPFVHYVGNQASAASEHFFGLLEAKSDLVGLVLLDRQAPVLTDKGPLRRTNWRQREIENYLASPEILGAYARALADQRAAGPLFASAERQHLGDLMRSVIEDQVAPAVLRNPADAWWRDVKASDDFLDRVFADFFTRLELPNVLRKTDYHTLAVLVPREQIDPEIREKLDLIVDVASRATPRR